MVENAAMKVAIVRGLPFTCASQRAGKLSTISPFRINVGSYKPGVGTTGLRSSSNLWKPVRQQAMTGDLCFNR
jgi:hypothetical protein